jgi:hypothetical protein
MTTSNEQVTGGIGWGKSLALDVELLAIAMAVSATPRFSPDRDGRFGRYMTASLRGATALLSTLAAE